MRSPLYFSVGLPLTMVFISILASRAIHGTEIGYMPESQTAKRLYGESRDAISREFGLPRISYAKNGSWQLYEKDDTEIRVRFHQDKADRVLATNVSKDTNGSTTCQLWPSLQTNTYDAILDEL